MLIWSHEVNVAIKQISGEKKAKNNRSNKMSPQPCWTITATTLSWSNAWGSRHILTCGQRPHSSLGMQDEQCVSWPQGICTTGSTALQAMFLDSTDCLGHKQDVPLRPIISFVSLSTYQLSKFLASVLSPIGGLSDQHVRNSQHFTQFVTTQKLRDTEVLVSFNVVSLFTQIPTNRAIQVTRQRLLNDPS